MRIRSILIRRNPPQYIPMRNKDNRLLRTIPQELPHEPRAVSERSRVGGPETAFASPVTWQVEEVDTVEFGVGGEDFCGGTGVAGVVVAFLGLREGYDLGDTA
jgi:hypothetical protein